MIRRVTNGVVCLLTTAAIALADSGYMYKLREFSFDMNLMREYPSGWQTSGSAVPILSKVKLLPSIPNVNGQLFMKKELATAAWDVTYRFILN